MNNKERFKIAIECLKDAKPLKEICLEYYVSEDDIKKHGLEDEIKIPEFYSCTTVYHLTESNKILSSYEFDSRNRNDDYCLFYRNEDYYRRFVVELRYIEKANVFALCNYFVKCPILGTAKVDFIGACIITPDKHTKLYKVKSWEKAWNKINRNWGNYYGFLVNLSSKPLNNSVASWNKTFGKLFPLIHYRKGEYLCTIDTMFHLGGWMLRDEFRRKNTDKQKQINKLLKLPLKKVTKSNLAFKKGTKFGRRAFIEHIKDDMICIRYFQRNDFTEEIFEIMRFYIDKKDVYFCQKNSLGQFVATSFDKEPDAIRYFCADKTIFDKLSSFEDTIIDYYKDMIESNITRETVQIILLCRLYPHAEKFLKQDYKEPVCYYLDERFTSFDEFLENRYGKINYSASSPGKILGVNEYQLATIKRFKWDVQTCIIKNAKYMVGDEMLPSLTNKQTDELFFIIKKDYEYYTYYIFSCFKLLREMYSLKTAFSMVNDFIKIQRKIRRYDNRCHIASFYKDYLIMIKELGMANVYHPQFKDKNDIQKMHDEIFEIYNVKKTIIQNEKFAKRIEVLKKFEYVDNDFSVVAPKEAEDLANEGIKLHHCVKSYIGRVANGETNIVFIRENTDLEKPFFTVEITNDNTIQQVHGFGNRNANTEPGLTEFVEKWAKDKNLMLHDINKIR